MDNEKILKILTSVKSERNEIESQIDEILSYTIPHKQWLSQSKIDDRGKIYDTTAINSLLQLTTTILSNFIPIGKQWLRFVMSKKSVKEIGLKQDIIQALQAENDIFFDELNKSNFHLAVASAIEDLVIMGKATLTVEYCEGKLKYVNHPWNKVYITEGNNRKISLTFFESEMTVHNIRDRFDDEEDSKLPDELFEKNDDYFKKYKIIEMFRKTEEFESDYDEDNPYEYSVLLQYTKNKEQLYTIQKINTNYPVVINARWSLSTNTPYGVGPGHFALADLRSINELAKENLRGASLRCSPPIISSDPNLKDRKIDSGTMIYTDDKDIKPIVFSDINAVAQDIRVLAEQIKRTFMDYSLPPVEASKNMTATEVSIRQQQFFSSLGHTALMLEEELLKPLVESTIAILQKNNILQDNYTFGPDKQADIEYYSIVRTSKNFDSVQTDIQALQSISIFGPEVVSSLVDIQGLAVSILNRLDFSSNYIKTPEQVQAEALQKQQATAAGAITSSLLPNSNTQPDKLGQAFGGLAQMIGARQ